MKLADIKRIGVVGAGTMGHGIALSFALWGYPVSLVDINTEALQKALERIRLALDSFVEAEVVTRRQAEEAVGRIAPATELDGLASADYICEAVTERSAEKNRLFHKLDAICPAHTILASNTSSLVLSDFGAGIGRQDKLVITHYFNPPHLVPCVEVVKGPGTSEETFDLTYDLLEKVKKLPVRVHQELPGYLVNRIQMGMRREAFDLWAKGIASAEDIDRAVVGSFGFRLASIGPLLTLDLAGLPAKGRLATEIFNGLFGEISAAAEIPPELGRRWESHRGFYDYSPEEWQQVVKQRDREFLKLLKQFYWK